MAKRQIKASELQGLDIYQDPKKGTLIYDIFSRNAYHLTTSDISTYTLSKAILPVSILLIYIINLISKNMALSIILGIAIYAILQIVYRFAWLYKLPCEKNYKRPGGNNFIENLASRYSKPQIVALVVLCSAIVAVSIIYIIVDKLQGGMLYVFILTSALALVMDLLFIGCLIKK